MPSHYAALLVIGLLILVGGPILYWVFFKMDSPADTSLSPPEPIRPLTDDDVTRIEFDLNILLPTEYIRYLTLERSWSTVDDTTVLSDVGAIIQATQDYRRGFSGLPPWPQSFIYVGDEADACPYALDTASRRVLRLDKGNWALPPLVEYPTFASFIDSFSHDED